MVVDPGRRTRRPDEDLHRVGVPGVVVARGYVPIFSRFLHEGQDVRGQEVRIVHQIGQDGFPKCNFRGRYAQIDLAYCERHLYFLSLDPSTTRYLHLTGRHGAPGTSCSGRRENQRSVVRSAWGKVSRDVLRDVLCVPPHAGEDIRCRGILERHSHEIQARLSDHDAAFVQGTFVFIEDGEVDPGKLLPEPRAPDHIRHVQHASVLEHWATVLYAHGPRHLLDSGGNEVFQLDADERRAMGDKSRLSLPPDGRPQRQHMVADEPYHGEHEPRRSGSVTDRDLSRGSARQVCGMQAGHLESDLRSRVASANHQNGTFLVLRRTAVLTRMELYDARK